MPKTISKDKPLPTNTEYHWDECFAKIILESIFPNYFHDLILSDKPDLQNEELALGIEVTTAVTKDDLEIDRLHTALEYGNVRDKDGTKKHIKKLGGTYREGILMHPVRYRDLTLIDSSIINKLEKLNSGQYNAFNNNYLFITDVNLILENECADLLNKYINMQQAYKYKFQKIYIYMYGGKLYEFDLVAEKYDLFEISSNKAFDISMAARKMVEDKENGII